MRATRDDLSGADGKVDERAWTTSCSFSAAVPTTIGCGSQLPVLIIEKIRMNDTLKMNDKK